MNIIAAIRKSLGISQQELAGILGISRTALSMVEKDQRKLSPSAVVKLGRLEIKHAAAGEKNGVLKDDVIGEETKNSYRIFLDERKTKCADQLSKYQKQLDEMISIHASAKKRKSILQSETEIFAGVGQYQTQLEKLMQTSEKKIKRYDPALRLFIQFEITQLESQLRHIEEEFIAMNPKIV